MSYSSLLFGEGGTDYRFLGALIKTKKFKHYTTDGNWAQIQLDSGAGGSPETVLSLCDSIAKSRSYQLIICLIDLDVMKARHKSKWEDAVNILEAKYPNIHVVWQRDKAQDEYKRVLIAKGVITEAECRRMSDGKINELAIKNPDKFINSDLWNQIIQLYKETEDKLNVEELEPLDSA